MGRNTRSNPYQYLSDVTNSIELQWSSYGVPPAASENTSRQCHYLAFKPAMLNATASPFTVFPLKIHRSLRKVKKAEPVYFGRWNIFWKSNILLYLVLMAEGTDGTKDCALNSTMTVIQWIQGTIHYHAFTNVNMDSSKQLQHNLWNYTNWNFKTKHPQSVFRMLVKYYRQKQSRFWSNSIRYVSDDWLSTGAI